MVYSNLLKGVTTSTNVAPTEGGYTNFILANGSHGIGFYTLSESGDIAAGKAYLQLPTADITALAPQGISLVFDDGQGTTGIAVSTLVPAASGACYDLQGRRVEHPSRGLYIVNNKKVFIK